MVKLLRRWGLPILLVLLVLLYSGASFFIANGVTGDERGPLEDHPVNYGLAFEEVQFTSRDDGVELKGWWLPGEKDTTLIFVHGITGDRTADGAVDLASRMVDLGYDVLMFDQRAHGESGGGRVSGGYHERKDLGGAIDFLVARGVEKSDMGVLAMSMGTGTTLLTLVDEPQVRAAVLDSPYATADDLIVFEVARKTPFPEWLVPVFLPGAKLVARVLYGIKVGELAPERAVAELEYPVLVIHGDDDTRIPYEHGQRVFQASHDGSEFWTVPGVDHVDAFIEHPEEYVKRVEAYFGGQLESQ